MVYRRVRPVGPQGRACLCQTLLSTSQGIYQVLHTCHLKIDSIVVPLIMRQLYPASRGYIFTVRAGVRKVASANNRSNLSRNLDE